jgi:hypothetical protein
VSERRLGPCRPALTEAAEGTAHTEERRRGDETEQRASLIAGGRLRRPMRPLCFVSVAPCETVGSVVSACLDVEFLGFIRAFDADTGGRRHREAVAGEPVLPRGERERRAEWSFAARTCEGTCARMSGQG